MRKNCAQNCAQNSAQKSANVSAKNCAKNCAQNSAQNSAKVSAQNSAQNTAKDTHRPKHRPKHSQKYRPNCVRGQKPSPLGRPPIPPDSPGFPPIGRKISRCVCYRWQLPFARPLLGPGAWGSTLPPCPPRRVLAASSSRQSCEDRCALNLASAPKESRNEWLMNLRSNCSLKYLNVYSKHNAVNM